MAPQTFGWQPLYRKMNLRPDAIGQIVQSFGVAMPHLLWRNIALQNLL